MTNEHYSHLVRQAHYLGATRNSVINLKLFLNREVELSEKDISEALQAIRSDDQEQVFYSNFPAYYNDVFKSKQRFLYSIDEYVSAVLYIHMNHPSDHWEEADERVEKKVRIYSINNDILDDFVEFANEVSVSQAALLNYAFMNDFQAFEDEERFHYSNEKQKKGFELTLPSVSALDAFSRTDKEMVMNRLLKKIPEVLKTAEKN